MLKNNSNLTHLDIKKIKFPITAIASILHRISGFLLFIIIGPTLWLLKLSLDSKDNFQKINNFLLKNDQSLNFLKYGIIVLFNYHLIFGIRQILIDFGLLKPTLLAGKLSASVSFILVTLLSIYIGIYI